MSHPAAAELARRFGEALAACGGDAARRDRLVALSSAYLGFFDERRELFAAAEDGGEGRPLLEEGARALAPFVAEAYAEARDAGIEPDLAEEEAALSIWAMLEAVPLAALGRGESEPLAGKARLAGLALETMIAELARGEKSGTF